MLSPDEEQEAQRQARIRERVFEIEGARSRARTAEADERFLKYGCMWPLLIASVFFGILGLIALVGSIINDIIQLMAGATFFSGPIIGSVVVSLAWVGISIAVFRWARGSIFE